MSKMRYLLWIAQYQGHRREDFRVKPSHWLLEKVDLEKKNGKYWDNFAKLKIFVRENSKKKKDRACEI